MVCSIVYQSDMHLLPSHLMPVLSSALSNLILLYLNIYWFYLFLIFKNLCSNSKRSLFSCIIKQISWHFFHQVKNSLLLMPCVSWVTDSPSFLLLIVKLLKKSSVHFLLSSSLPFVSSTLSFRVPSTPPPVHPCPGHQ